MSSIRESERAVIPEQVRIIRPEKLSSEEISTWDSLQDGNRQLMSPFFSYEFTKAVAKIRQDVQVGVIERKGQIIGFLPFQKLRGRVGKPVGGPLSDFHGIIALPDTRVDAISLVDACSLDVFDFDHVLAGQNTFVPFHSSTKASPYLDLSHGYSHYAEQRQSDGVALVSKKKKKRWAKLERDVGPLRFEADVEDRNILDGLIRLKSAQYVRTGATDIFEYSWIRDVIETIHETRSPRCSGVLSALYAGDRLIAAHIGMRSRRVWHYWFPAYDAEYSAFSPGYLLFVKMAQVAESFGIEKIDLGAGEDSYKRRVSSDFELLAEGFVGRPSPATFFRGTRRLIEGVFEGLPLGPVSRLPKRGFGWLERRRRFS